MLALVIAEAVAVALLAVLVVGLLRSHAEILRALHGLGIDLDPAGGHAGPADPTAPLSGSRPLPPPITLPDDARAHDVAGERLDGSQVAMAVTGTDHDTLLLFLSATCGSCQPFWTSLRAGAVPPGRRVLAVAQEHDHRSRLVDLAGPDVDVILSDTAWRDYAVPGAPHAVLVHGPTARIIGEGTANSLDQLLSLLDQANQNRPQAPSGNPWTAGRDNAQRVDAELARAGIGPGHPSLSPQPLGSTDR